MFFLKNIYADEIGENELSININLIFFLAQTGNTQFRNSVFGANGQYPTEGIHYFETWWC